MTETPKNSSSPHLVLPFQLAVKAFNIKLTLLRHADELFEWADGCGECGDGGESERIRREEDSGLREEEKEGGKKGRREEEEGREGRRNREGKKEEKMQTNLVNLEHQSTDVLLEVLDVLLLLSHLCRHAPAWWWW